MHAKGAQLMSVVVPVIRDYLEVHPERPVTVVSGDAGMISDFLQQQLAMTSSLLTAGR